MEYRGNHPRSRRDLSAWLARAEPEAVIEPGLPIVDPHHHLFGSESDRLYYRLEDLRRDIEAGHRIIGTIYVEAYESGWREEGPEAMRPVGETEMIVACTSEPVVTATGECSVAAGIVCHADLLLGDAVAEVLQAHEEAADGRLRGLRHRTAIVDGHVGRIAGGKPRPHLLLDATFRRGFAHLGAFGLSFDAWVYHTQLGELIDLADAFPDTVIVADHCGGPIGVAEFSGRRHEVLAAWERDLRKLAERLNVRVKIGGLGMPLYGFGFERRAHPPTSAELIMAWRRHIEVCVAAFGTDRCMFESNFPVDAQSCGYRELWNAFKLATVGWSEDERKDLFYRTACRTYRLPDLSAAGDRLWSS